MDINVEKFLEIENKYNLNQIEIDGCNFWNYIRFDVWNIISENKLNLNFDYEKKKNKILKYLLMLKNIFVNNKILKNKNILFLNHSRRIKNNGIYECIYTDDLINKTEDNETFELSFKGKHFYPINTPNLYYMDLFELKCAFYYIFYKIFCRRKCKILKIEISNYLNKPISEILRFYDCEIDDKIIMNISLSAIIKYKFYYDRLRKVLLKVNPSVIIEVVYYGFIYMLINEIAKDLKIKTIELQHGNIYKNHLAYQSNSQTEIKQFPNKILAFSDYWKKQIKLPCCEVKTVGYPYLEKMINEHKKVQHSKYTILFISQGTIGKKLSSLAIDLSKLINKEHYRIIFKPHPSELWMLKDVYKDLCDTWVEVIDNNGQSIYDYFAISDAQIGAYSTALYEGLAYGLNTFIYKVGCYNDMKDLVEKGYASFISSANELMGKIEEKSKIKKVDLDFWPKNALNNIVKEIDKDLKVEN